MLSGMHNAKSTRHTGYCSVAFALLSVTLTLAPVRAAGQTTPAPGAGQATFSVFVRATPVGLERVEVASTPDGGWLITSTGQLSAPITLENQRFDLRYTRSWQPTRLEIDGVRAGQVFSLRSTFEAATARHEVQEGSQVSKYTEPMAPDAIVLPNYFFAAYEALVVRLTAAKVGDTVPIYLAPRGQITAQVNDILQQQIKTPTRTINARIYRITLTNPGRPLPAEIWSDEDHRLVRVSLPSVFLDVAREDIIAVSARLQTMKHPGDEDVRVRATGFSLAATITKPVNATPPATGWPTVLLVPGSASMDRDENLSEIPIFGQIAGALADRGFLVARYDKRGVGQSGGRSESATLRDYADDVEAMGRYLRRRPDVDKDRIAVVGHSDGAWVALAAAMRDDEIDTLVLVAAPASTGHDLVLEQQRTALERMAISNAEKQQKVELQHRINAAVLGRGPWDPVPPELRRQADTPWFRSFLVFDPADVVRRVRQPILILHGDLDKQVLPYHADRLVELARRRRDAMTDLIRLPGVNHLLVPASSGEMDEYRTLSDKKVGSTVIDALAEWLNKTESN